MQILKRVQDDVPDKFRTMQDEKAKVINTKIAKNKKMNIFAKI